MLPHKISVPYIKFEFHTAGTLT